MPRTIHLIAPLVLLSFAIPLLSLATVTTILAFTVLSFRVAIVYVELGFAIVNSWLFGDKKFKIKPQVNERPPSHAIIAGPRGTVAKQGRTPKLPSTPFYDTYPYHKRASATDPYVIGPGGTSRDYEGIGGWRMSGSKEEEATWLAMNSRLELPTAEQNISKRHKRTFSGPRISQSPSATRLSPVTSRNRTPPPEDAILGPDGYFSLRPMKAGQMSPEEFAARLRMEERRASVSSSSGSSKQQITLPTTETT